MENLVKCVEVVVFEISKRRWSFQHRLGLGRTRKWQKI